MAAGEGASAAADVMLAAFTGGQDKAAGSSVEGVDEGGGLMEVADEIE